MKWACVVCILASTIPVPARPQVHPVAETSEALAHVSNRFTLRVDTTMKDAARLFGPDGERGWAGDDWQPVFLFPIPAKDVEGAVFTVRHGEHKSVWVNTLFDVNEGRIQYVYFLSDLLVTTIDVRLRPIGSAQTEVEVTYVRTALVPDANDHVHAMGQRDREQGNLWESSIAAYLQGRKNKP